MDKVETEEEFLTILEENGDLVNLEDDMVVPVIFNPMDRAVLNEDLFFIVNETWMVILPEYKIVVENPSFKKLNTAKTSLESDIGNGITVFSKIISSNYNILDRGVCGYNSYPYDKTCQNGKFRITFNLYVDMIVSGSSPNCEYEPRIHLLVSNYKRGWTGIWALNKAVVEAEGHWRAENNFGDSQYVPFNLTSPGEYLQYTRYWSFYWPVVTKTYGCTDQDRIDAFPYFTEYNVDVNNNEVDLDEDCNVKCQ